MKTLRIGVPIALTLILAGMVATALWDQAHTLFPSPQNESTFLKTYSPQPVVDRFKCINCGADTLSGMREEGGEQFVRRTATYSGSLGLRSGYQFDLMNALRTDLLERLEAAGARLLRQTGNAHEGFRADYMCNNSLGSISILPIATSRSEPAQGWPQGFEEVTLNLVIDERWYPNGASAQRAAAHSEP